MHNSAAAAAMQRPGLASRPKGLCLPEKYFLVHIHTYIYICVGKRASPCPHARAVVCSIVYLHDDELMQVAGSTVHTLSQLGTQWRRQQQ